MRRLQRYYTRHSSFIIVRRSLRVCTKAILGPIFNFVQLCRRNGRVAMAGPIIIDAARDRGA